MEKITIKDGHLWRGKEKLKLEFGNLEQIEALKNYEKLVLEFEKGVEPKVYYEVIANSIFKCICEKTIELNDIEVDNEGDVDGFDGLAKKCTNCNRVYSYEVERKYARGYRGGMEIVDEKLLVKLKK